MMENKCDNDVVLTAKEILIVGGGTMGLFLASELIKTGQKVVIVEAGNDDLQSFSAAEFSTVGQYHSGISIGRTKAVGGTSNLWGGQLARFTEHDIESKNNYNQPNWPITWKELDFYYNEIFTLFGFKSTTSEYTKDLTNGINYLEKFHTYWLKQPNFKSQYYTILQNSPLVKIYTDASVTDILFDNDTCTSVEVKDKKGTFYIKGFEKLVLAQGTIEIIRLLLSTKLKENCPYKNNHFIGKYFQDHLCLRVAKIKNPTKAFFNDFANIIKNSNKLQPKIRLIPQINDSEHIGMSGYFSFSSDISQNLDLFKQFFKAVIGENQIEMTFFEKVKFFFRSMKSLQYAFPLIYRYIVDNRIYVPFNSEVTLCLQAQQISIEESSISIDEKVLDRNGMPKVILNWQVDGREFKRIKFFCDQTVKFISDNKFGEVVFESWYEKELKFANNEWKKNITDTYHIAGGAIMSTNANAGVVDENLKMHETSNVFIVGPTVLPTSSYANTGLTALALVLRLSKHLQ